MNKRVWLFVGGLLILLLAGAVALWRTTRPEMTPSAPAASDRVESSDTAVSAPASAIEAQESIGPTQETEADSGLGLPGVLDELPSAEAETSREQARHAWESLLDHLIEHSDAPPEGQASRVKAAFDELDPDDQLDGIRLALNLLPDEQFSALESILFDNTEQSEVLDAIFSDALNRPEAIKFPLLKELRKDREHPMFFESVRILDVTETVEDMP